jgi:hypothetical protein
MDDLPGRLFRALAPELGVAPAIAAPVASSQAPPMC